jgi:hypothetical protein
MKSSEKKSLLKHISKDSKEFKSQLKEDQKLRKAIMKSSPERRKK